MVHSRSKYFQQQIKNEVFVFGEGVGRNQGSKRRQTRNQTKTTVGGLLDLINSMYGVFYWEGRGRGKSKWKGCRCSYIIYLMKQHGVRPGKEVPDYRQSLSFLSSQLLRNSLSSQSSSPYIYRESLGTSFRTRNTLSIQLAEQLLLGLQRQRKDRDKAQLSNLKSTLSQLQKKINKAKKKLNTFTNIIGEQSDEENEDQERGNCKTPIKMEDLTTEASSASKLGTTTLGFHQTKLKGYYLSNLAQALEGRNKRALDHLNISLKVLKNYFKIESPTYPELEQRRVVLPRDKADIGKKTLLVDIDETLLHCEEEPTGGYDLQLPIQVQNGSTAHAYITIRPYAITFLKRMSKIYEIVAFTASHQSYADVVLDQIDPERQYIKHRLYRKNCIQIHENIYAKDLRIVNRDLSSMVLIDNAPYSYIFQLQNGIPILPYYTGEDNELAQLQKYLQQMSKVQDVREFNKGRFKLHKYCLFSDMEHLIHELYARE